MAQIRITSKDFMVAMTSLPNPNGFQLEFNKRSLIEKQTIAILTDKIHDVMSTYINSSNKHQTWISDPILLEFRLNKRKSGYYWEPIDEIIITPFKEIEYE